MQIVANVTSGEALTRNKKVISQEVVDRFKLMMTSDEKIPVKSMARTLRVSRQTIYNWMARYEAGKEVSPPSGRKRKYKSEKSVSVAIRIPESLADRILESSGLSHADCHRQLRIALEKFICQESARLTQAGESSSSGGAA